MRFGVNVDPAHGFTAADVLASGATAVRVVLRPKIDLAPFFRDCKASSIYVLGVIARESMLTGTDTNAVNFNTAGYYEWRYGQLLDAVQIGNEPDLKSPSSWTLAAFTVSSIAKAFRGPFINKQLIGPGLASGDPAWADSLQLDLFDALAVHPYGQAPAKDWTGPGPNFGYVGDLLDAYRRFNKPLWVTEYGANQDELGEQGFTNYVAAMTKSLTNLVPMAFHFCLDDAMVPNFGLFHDGQPKPVVAEIHQVLRNLPQETTMKIEDFVKAHPDKLKASDPKWGTPIIVGGGVRIAIFDDYVVVESNGECSPVKIDASFFP